MIRNIIILFLLIGLCESASQSEVDSLRHRVETLERTCRER